VDVFYHTSLAGQTGKVGIRGYLNLSVAAAIFEVYPDWLQDGPSFCTTAGELADERLIIHTHQ